MPKGPQRIKAPEATKLLEAANRLVMHLFGRNPRLSPRLPFDLLEGREIFKDGLVCGIHRGGLTLGGLWIGQAEEVFVGLVVAPNGVVLGLFEQIGGRWARRRQWLEGRKIKDLLEGPLGVGLPAKIGKAIGEGVKMLLNLLRPNMELLAEHRVDLLIGGLPASLKMRPFPGREDLPFEAEVFAGGEKVEKFSVEVRSVAGDIAGPDLVCITPWESLLWRGRLKPGSWTLIVKEGREQRFPFWVLPAPVRKAIFFVEGLKGILDAARIERALKVAPGVGQVRVDIKKGQVEVRAVPGAILFPAEIKKRLEAIGFKVTRVEVLK